MDYAQESIISCLSEAQPLLEAHFKEIAHYPDIPLNPSYDEYRKLEELGFLKVYTARHDGILVGYAVFFIRYNLHYSTSLQAVQDILFIKKDYRGNGGKFILWCDEKLKSDGVQAVYHHIKVKHNFGKLLEKFGYELVDLIYARRLDNR